MNRYSKYRDIYFEEIIFSAPGVFAVGFFSFWGSIGLPCEVCVWGCYLVFDLVASRMAKNQIDAELWVLMTSLGAIDRNNTLSPDLKNLCNGVENGQMISASDKNYTLILDSIGKKIKESGMTAGYIKGEYTSYHDGKLDALRLKKAEMLGQKNQIITEIYSIKQSYLNPKDFAKALAKEIQLTTPSGFYQREVFISLCQDLVCRQAFDNDSHYPYSNTREGSELIQYFMELVNSPLQIEGNVHFLLQQQVKKLRLNIFEFAVCLHEEMYLLRTLEYYSDCKFALDSNDIKSEAVDKKLNNMVHIQRAMNIANMTKQIMEIDKRALGEGCAFEKKIMHTLFRSHGIKTFESFDDFYQSETGQDVENEELLLFVQNPEQYESLRKDLEYLDAQFKLIKKVLDDAPWSEANLRKIMALEEGMILKFTAYSCSGIIEQDYYIEPKSLKYISAIPLLPQKGKIEKQYYKKLYAAVLKKKAIVCVLDLVMKDPGQVSSIFKQNQIDDLVSCLCANNAQSEEILKKSNSIIEESGFSHKQIIQKCCDIHDQNLSARFRKQLLSKIKSIEEVEIKMKSCLAELMNLIKLLYQNPHNSQYLWKDLYLCNKEGKIREDVFNLYVKCYNFCKERNDTSSFTWENSIRREPKQTLPTINDIESCNLFSSIRQALNLYIDNQILLGEAEVEAAYINHHLDFLIYEEARVSHGINNIFNSNIDQFRLHQPFPQGFDQFEFRNTLHVAFKIFDPIQNVAAVRNTFLNDFEVLAINMVFRMNIGANFGVYNLNQEGVPLIRGLDAIISFSYNYNEKRFCMATQEVKLLIDNNLKKIEPLLKDLKLLCTQLKAIQNAEQNAEVRCNESDKSIVQLKLKLILDLLVRCEGQGLGVSDEYVKLIVSSILSAHPNQDVNSIEEYCLSAINQKMCNDQQVSTKLKKILCEMRNDAEKSHQEEALIENVQEMHILITIMNFHMRVGNIPDYFTKLLINQLNITDSLFGKRVTHLFNIFNKDESALSKYERKELEAFRDVLKHIMLKECVEKFFLQPESRPEGNIKKFREDISNAMNRSEKIPEYFTELLINQLNIQDEHPLAKNITQLFSAFNENMKQTDKVGGGQMNPQYNAQKSEVYQKVLHNISTSSCQLTVANSKKKEHRKNSVEEFFEERDREIRKDFIKSVYDIKRCIKTKTKIDDSYKTKLTYSITDKDLIEKIDQLFGEFNSQDSGHDSRKLLAFVEALYTFFKNNDIILPFKSETRSTMLNECVEKFFKYYSDSDYVQIIDNNQVNQICHEYKSFDEFNSCLSGDQVSLDEFNSCLSGDQVSLPNYVI